MKHKMTKRDYLTYLFIVAKQIHILLRFLALCLCLQHFDDNLLLLNQESTLDSGWGG